LAKNFQIRAILQGARVIK